jgi:hypothetical protein
MTSIETKPSPAAAMRPALTAIPPCCCSGVVDGRRCLSLSAACGPNAARTSHQFAVAPDALPGTVHKREMLMELSSIGM